VQLGDLIRGLDDDTHASELLTASGDVALIARLHDMASRFEESAGEYVGGAVRRFANLADHEDWLALMNTVERAGDPAVACLVHMVGWSLKKDVTPAAPKHQGCSCGSCGCA
jgi:hypothetical protein